MSKTLTELNPVELMALCKTVNLSGVNCEDSLPPASSAYVDFTVRIQGELARGEAKDRAGTNRARTAEAMVMLLVMSGVTRTHSPSKIIQAWRDLGSLDKAAMAERVKGLEPKDRALHDECLELFESEIVANLPRIPTKGYLKFYSK